MIVRAMGKPKPVPSSFDVINGLKILSSLSSGIDAIAILRPEPIVRWHRKGFSAFWRWKSRPLGGRPRIDKEVRDLIRRMSFENPLWGAPHIHGELLKLGFDIAQSTVSKYMVPRRGRPSQTWKTFLHNHADGIASMLGKDAPNRRPIERFADIVAHAILGGLHHRYARI